MEIAFRWTSLQVHIRIYTKVRSKQHLKVQQNLQGMHFFLISAMHDLNNNLNFLLEDKDGISEELRLKFLNVMKMLVYLYTNIVIFMENKMRTIEKQTIQVKVR